MQNETIQKVATQSKRFWSHPVTIILGLIIGTQLLIIQQQEQAKPIVIPDPTQVKSETVINEPTPAYLHTPDPSIAQPQEVYRK